MSDIDQNSGRQNAQTEKGAVDALRSALTKEVYSQVAKFTVIAVVALASFAGLGWWLYLKNAIDTYIATRTVPIGAVMAFDLPDGCPSSGWSEFKDGSGKVIIGIGPGRPYRAYGGSDTLVLKTENLPPHQHETIIGLLPSDVGSTYGAGPGRKAVAGAAYNAVYPVALTSANLAGVPNPPAPIITMPPYIALTLCKRAT